MNEGLFLFTIAFCLPKPTEILDTLMAEEKKNCWACENCKIRNEYEEVSRFCSYSFEIISSGLNTSYCQTARFLRPFNTTSKPVVNKPITCSNLGHQLVWNQRPVSYFLIPSHRGQELSQWLLNTLAFLQNTWPSQWPKMSPPRYTSSSPAFITP